MVILADEVVSENYLRGGDDKKLINFLSRLQDVGAVELQCFIFVLKVFVIPYSIFKLLYLYNFFQNSIS